VNWSDLLNPFEGLGNAAASYIADSWTVGMLAIWNAGLWLLSFVLQLEDQYLVPDMSADGPMRAAYGFTFWFAGALVLVLLLLQLALTAWRRDGESLARALLGTVQFGGVVVAWISYAVMVVAAAGGINRALLRGLLDVDTMASWEPWTGFSVEDITDGTMATVLGLMGIFLVFGAIGHFLVLLARAAALIVLAATNPISAAGLLWEPGKRWFWMGLRWFHAAAFTPVVMTLMLGLSTRIATGVAQGEAGSLEEAIGTAIPAVSLILISSFVPLALFKMLAFVDPGTSSGAAMRAGLAAQGGLQGMFSRGSPTSDAAATSDSSGRSQGEAATESATSDRFAASAGGLMAAVGGPVGQAISTGWGMAQGLASQAASVGADMTNQMGVGHAMYVPDFSGSRSSGNRSGRPGGDGAPDTRGDAPDTDGGVSPTVNDAPGPVPAPTPGPGGVKTPAGGGAGAGGGAAGAGGASAAEGAAARAAVVAL